VAQFVFHIDIDSWTAVCDKIFPDKSSRKPALPHRNSLDSAAPHGYDFFVPAGQSKAKAVAAALASVSASASGSKAAGQKRKERPPRELDDDDDE
jgi:hypothetical protein